MIQDYEFPQTTLRLQCTRDGRHVMATGVYKPQIRVFELSEMSMKFERHTDCDNVAFEMVSSDWTKSVHLQSDRSIDFHAAGGIHYSVRIPKFGRDLAFHHASADLLVGASGSDVYRLNLELGRFMTPLPTQLRGVNAVEVNPVHQLYAFGGEDGTEFWDPRCRSRIAALDILEALRQSGATSVPAALPETTAIKFGWDGLSMALGTSSGHVLLFDLRNPMPTVVKDHGYGLGIKRLDFWNDKVVSADQRVIKIWEKNVRLSLIRMCVVIPKQP